MVTAALLAFGILATTAAFAGDATGFTKTFDPSYISTDLDAKQETRAGTTATVLATLAAGGTLVKDGASAAFTGSRTTVGRNVIETKGTMTTQPVSGR